MSFGLVRMLFYLVVMIVGLMILDARDRHIA